MYPEVPGVKFLMLGSGERTNDIIVKFPTMYSDRMVPPMREL